MKAVLLGMNNPLSRNPRHALWPSPPGCTGHRLLRLLQTRRPEVTSRDYLRGFDRMNILDGPWDVEKARDVARALPSLLRGRTVVVLGDGPRRVLGLPRILVHPHYDRGVTWRQLPHPSGRNRWYNDETCRALAATLLDELYTHGETDVVHTKDHREEHRAQ